uniref:Death-related Ced-3/Nedd2-like protein n=1 Tax=Plutella xylostella TaxID=51655 RepID=A0AA51ZUM2_PLUXY|nr:death-related Ced-3/Nedd2-like protein [Plutella xylostella]
MLQPDALKGHENDELNSVHKNIHNITVNVIAEVQRDLTPYDITSLVFLLYDIPETALQRLTLLQRVSRDISGKDLNLLYDWAVYAHLRATWKYEFLEALVVCQLYGVIRKLGFSVPTVKKLYSTENPVVCHISPMKIALYRLCEEMNSDNLNRFKKTLLSYNIDVSQHETTELVLLELLCCRFISIAKINDLRQLDNECEMDKLVKIIENCPGLLSCAQKIKEAERKLNTIFICNDKNVIHHSTPEVSVSEPNSGEKYTVNEKFTGNFNDIYDSLAHLMEEKLSFVNLKADTTKPNPDTYHIRNTKRVGICYIINQETFYPTKESIENKINSVPLETRKGSSKDRDLLKSTMENLNFHVEISNDLRHDEILPSIKKAIRSKVQDEDSIFILCILSHGIEGHIYGADSVPLNVKDIEQLLDSEDAVKLRNKPKVLIIQACQSRKDKDPLKLIADGPQSSRSNHYYLPKSDFLILWATAPEYEAYRLGSHGSVFIHLLCDIIHKTANKQHFADMCTKVTNNVSLFCANFKHAQIPIFQSTLRKSLYFMNPEIK